MRGESQQEMITRLYDTNLEYKQKALGAFWQQRMLRWQMMKSLAVGSVVSVMILAAVIIPNRLDSQERRRYNMAVSKSHLDEYFSDADLVLMKERLVRKMYKNYDSESSVRANREKWV